MKPGVRPATPRTEPAARPAPGRLAALWRRLPWRRRQNRLGLTKRGRAPLRRGRRATKLAIAVSAACAGVALGAFRGEALLARLAPRGTQLVALEIVGNLHTDAARVAAASGLGANLTLADVDPATVARGIAALPWVRRVRATTLPPNRVVVAIEERVPVAVARLADGSRWLVDAAGVAFAPAPVGTQGTELVGLASAAAHNAPQPELATGVALLAQWNAAHLPPARAIEVGGALGGELPAVQLADRPLRVLVGGGDARDKLARFARVLALREPALARAIAIDLRFPGQGVLRFAPPCPVEAKTLGDGARPGTDPGSAPSLGGEEQCHAKTT